MRQQAWCRAALAPAAGEGESAGMQMACCNRAMKPSDGTPGHSFIVDDDLFLGFGNKPSESKCLVSLASCLKCMTCLRQGGFMGMGLIFLCQT